MRSFRHPRWQHLDYRVKVATTQENKPPTQGTRQWTFTTPRWRCGSILLPSLNAGVPDPTGGKVKQDQPFSIHTNNDFSSLLTYQHHTHAIYCTYIIRTWLVKFANSMYYHFFSFEVIIMPELLLRLSVAKSSCSFLCQNFFTESAWWWQAEKSRAEGY